MPDICTDNRFELIEKYKKELIEATNIETSQDEMAVLDSLLFRFWQMRWLDRLEQPERKKGKWIQSEEKEGMEFTFYEIHCSECGVLRKIGWTGANFCPNCGADMRG